MYSDILGHDARMPTTGRSPWKPPVPVSGSAKTRPAIRVLAALALLLAGLLPAASAHGSSVSPQSGSGTITGRVVLPPDLVLHPTNDFILVHAVEHGPHHLNAVKVHGWYGAVSSATVAPDGSFTLSGLPQQEYRLRVYKSSDRDDYLNGWYAGPGKEAALQPEGGAPVYPGASDLEINFHKSAPISGVIKLSDTVTAHTVKARLVVWNTSDPARVEYGQYSRLPWMTSGGSKRLDVTADGVEFTIPKHRTDGKLILEVNYDDGRVGYFHANADGVVGDYDHATILTAGDHIDITIGPSLVSPALTPYVAPRLTGEAVVGEKLTLEPGRWSLPGATVQRHRWLRDGVWIPGVSGAEYTPQEADLGATITARVTVAKSGFDTATFDYSTPGPVRERTPEVPDPEVPDPEVPTPEQPTPEESVTETTAPEATVAPQVRGTTRLGKTLRATPGTWDIEGVRVTYQWLRDGKSIKGATSARYKVKRKDVARRLSVRATASLDGREPGVATSKARKIAKGKPKVTARVKNIKAGKRAKVSVRVRAAGLAKPRGTLSIKYGKKTIRVKLAAKRKGKATVRLPKLKKGTYRVRVTYKPTGSSKKLVTKASSKRVTLRVR